MRVLGVLLLAAVLPAAGAQKPKWGGDYLRQKTEWYAGPEALALADVLLACQRDNGGWGKNVDYANVTADDVKAAQADRANPEATIDNGATHTEIRYLAKVWQAAKLERCKEGALRGIELLLKTQYPNGGWPQFVAGRTKGYWLHVTFNDGAMVGVLSLLDDIARKRPEFAFVDEERRQKCEQAVAKGVECILKCQVVVAGKRTAWCAQHDEKTLKPAKARAYELPSLSGAESVGILRFLMSIEKPGPEVVEAVRAAAAWFQKAKITGIRVEKVAGAQYENGGDRVVVKDAKAPPLWARFYEIETGRPFFCSRDGIRRYTLAEISHERRNGYAWYGDWPAELLAKEYPAWEARFQRR